MSTYEGWSNRATWTVALWIDNDETLYRYAQNIGIGAEDDTEVGATIENWLEEMKPELSGVWADLLAAAWDQVNWTEIGAHVRAE